MLNQFKNILSSSSPNQEEINQQKQNIDTANDSGATKTVEWQLQQGDELYHQGELEQALSYYRRAIEIDENSTQAHQKLAMALQKSGNLPEAMIHYRKAIALNNYRENIKEENKSLSPDFQGKIFEQDLGRYTQINQSSSVRISSPKIENQPPQNERESPTKSTLVPGEKQVNLDGQREAAEVYLQQALAYSDEQRWPEVITACQQAVQIIPDLAEAYKLWGNALQRIGNTSEAMGLYAKALEIQPDLAEVYANLGTLYAQQQKWPKAREYYQKAIVIKPDFAGAYRNLAKVWKQLGEPEKAAECQTKSLSLGSQIVKPEEYLQLGDRSLVENKPEQAIALYLQALKLSPELRIGYQKIAETWEKLGKWQEAASYYRQMIQLESPSSNPQPQLPGKNPNQALPSAKQSIVPKLPVIRKSQQLLQTSSPSSSQPNTVLPNISNQITKLDLAITRYEEQSSHLANSAPMQANLGSLYAQKQDWQKAVKCYQRAIELDPTIAGVYRNLAKVLEKLGQEADAAKCWYQALSLEPESADAQKHLELGATLSKHNQLEEAIACYRQAIELKPDYDRAYFRIGEILQSCGHNGEAIACLQKAIQLNNSQPSYYHRLGQILVQAEKFDRAIICYQQAIKLQPNHWETYHHLGKVLSRLSRWQEAVVVYNQALAIDKRNPEFYLGLGNALAKTEELDKAIVAYQLALQIQPGYREASVQLANVLRQKDYDTSSNKVEISRLQQISSISENKIRTKEQQVKLDRDLPLVSICIPTYNGEKYLHETIRSVFAQSYKNLEIIVSDDNSQDRTIEIAREYQNKSPVKFTIFEHEQYGIAGNWNFSIAKSQGKYIKFIFQDDLMLPQCVEQMVQLAEMDEDIGLVFSPREVFLAEGAETDHGCIQVHEHGQDVHLSWSDLKPIQQGTELLSDPKFFQAPLNKIGEPSTVLIRKSVFDRIGLFDEELHQTLDMDMWFRIMCNYKIGFCDRRLVKFRVHPNQASHKNLGLKNALDNQILRAKMLYSPQYQINDAQVKNVLRSGTQQLMKSELEQLLGLIKQLDRQVQTIPEKEREIIQIKEQLRKTEKSLEIKLGLREKNSNELYKYNQIEYKLTIKQAWEAYKNGDIEKMIFLLEKSKTLSDLLPTELLLDWLTSFSQLSAENEEDLNVYSLINLEDWEKTLVPSKLTLANNFANQISS